jgi:predicted nucleic acid-binding protein
VPAFALDTNCIVAAVCDWHEDHAAAAAAIEGRLARGEQRVVAAHALVEAYAVLTRLPPPHRLTPADAWTLLEANFVTGVRIVALTGAACVRLTRRLAACGLGGGRAYDAIIGECARRGGAETLLTFNDRHFQPAPTGLTIVKP